MKDVLENNCLLKVIVFCLHPTLFGSVAKKKMEEIPMSDLVLLVVMITPRVELALNQPRQQPRLKRCLLLEPDQL